MLLSMLHCLAMLRKNSGTEAPSSCQRPTWLALTRTLAQGEKDGPLRELCFSQVYHHNSVTPSRRYGKRQEGQTLLHDSVVGLTLAGMRKRCITAVLCVVGMIAERV